MQVSIIIINYNTKEITKTCIESIFKNTKNIDFEIILVDNASNDGSFDLFNNDSRITYIYNKENLGFGKANNLGYERCKGRYILLLNSDTILLNNAIKLFHDYMESNSNDVGCIGSILLDKENNTGHSYGDFHSLSNTLYEWFIFPVLKKIKIVKSLSKYDNPQLYKKNEFEVPYIIGANLFIRKTIIEKYGLFDPDFFLYFEDTELQHRYAKNNIKRVIIEGPQIIHLEGKSNTDSNSFKRREIQISSLILYWKKTQKRYNYIFYKLTFLTLYLIRLLFEFNTKGSKYNHINFVLSLY